MRIFVAAEINNAEVLNSIQKVQSDLDLRAKPVALNNIHFTMLFLGEISEKISFKVQDALNSIQFEEFDVKFQGIGAFPKARSPRVVWVGTDERGGRQLSELASIVEDTLSPLGFHSDKPFRPHVTIFRVKNKIGNISDKLESLNSTKFGVQKISEIKLKKSVLTSTGPNYTDLQVIRAR
ncbi:MAG: RNA 2',3'-cyclic phosphodiesterase [Nitrosopumilales archaeon]|nr:MAG: RNA 2',3'-cyclic phosphodiesterase [Nitrosopumilales archaeon]